MQPWKNETDPDVYQYMPYADLVPDREMQETADEWMVRIRRTAASVIEEFAGTPDDAAAIIAQGAARVAEWQAHPDYWFDLGVAEALRP